MAKKPSGLTIERAELVMSCKWKKGQTYTAQQFQYKVNDGKWTSSSITSGATSKSITLTASNYYPTSGKPQVTAFRFRVRGKADGKWSSWTDKLYTFGIPDVPNLEEELQTSNSTKFTWYVETVQHFTHIRYESMLIKDNTETDGSRLAWVSTATGWQTNTGTSSSSTTITESNIANASWTRWFRVRSEGIAGASAWRYASHVYASPNQAENVDIKPTLNTAGGTDILVSWAASAPVSNPIDETVVQYVIATPNSDLSCPNNLTWTDADISSDTEGTDSSRLQIAEQAGEDECLYVRVNTKHDNTTTIGVAQLSAIGYLKSPNLTSATPNYTNHTVAFTIATQTAVNGAYTECFYRTSSAPDKTNKLGIIASGTSTGTFTIPDLSGETAVGFGIRSRVDGSNTSMYSVYVWTASSVPTAPTSLTLRKTDIEGTISANWVWSWAAATGLELSWADHEDAWYSTEEPEKFTVSDTHATEWHISGLEMGKQWYVRVRLMQETDDAEIYSPWSDIKSIDLSTTPSNPVLALSDGVVTTKGSVTAYWSYLNEDGTNQIYAEICEATISNGSITYGSPFAHTQTAQQITIDANRWNAGTTHNLCVRTTSGSNHTSGWSAPVAVTVANPLTATFSATSLSSNQLTAMPLTATISGAGAGGTTSLVIERAADYHVDRPDETDFNGYEGETIVSYTQKGEAQITITNEMLIGALDDGAQYKLIGIVEDGLGQKATASVDFVVAWSHQAQPPASATVTINSDNVAVMSAVAPQDFATGDYLDIYRLSADKPELIISGGTYGTEYVDPYPAVGGGYRFVGCTANGDYITSDATFAWIDVDNNFNSIFTIIDFGDQTVNLLYDIELSSSWSKDFRQTRYLGGSVVGDWNAGVTRSIDVTTISIELEDAATIQAMRDLAEYEGVCHIRTQDGSNYHANLEVSESRSYQRAGKYVEFSITGTRVDPQELDGLTLAEWL